jgi:basic membrane protein A and related proteins
LLCRIAEGKFTAEEYGPLFDDETQGVRARAARVVREKVPSYVVTKVMAKEKAILAGQFNVKVDDSQPKSTAK